MAVGSEFFRTQHRHRQVGEQGQGDEPDEEGFHGVGRLEIFTAARVGGTDDKEGHQGGEEDEVDHDAPILVDRVQGRELKAAPQASKRR